MTWYQLAVWTEGCDAPHVVAESTEPGGFRRLRDIAVRLDALGLVQAWRVATAEGVVYELPRVSCSGLMFQGRCSGPTEHVERYLAVFTDALAKATGESEPEAWLALRSGDEAWYGDVARRTWAAVA